MKDSGRQGHADLALSYESADGAMRAGISQMMICAERHPGAGARRLDD